jgi:hypothetical protein
MNANTNLNVLGGILDAMLANLVETIDKRVEAQVLPLTQRITVLETDLKAVEGQLYDLKNAVFTLTQRIMALEIDNAALQILLTNSKDATPVVRPTDDVILRLDKLEARLAGEQPDTKFDLCILDSEEFRLAVIKIIDQQVMEDTFINPLVDALVDSDKFNDAVNTAAVDAASSEVEEALDNHTSDYDHDDIHEMSDHEMDSDAIREVVEEILNNSTITLKI